MTIPDRLTADVSFGLARTVLNPVALIEYGELTNPEALHTTAPVTVCKVSGSSSASPGTATKRLPKIVEQFWMLPKSSVLLMIMVVMIMVGDLRFSSVNGRKFPECPWGYRPERLL